MWAQRSKSWLVRKVRSSNKLRSFPKFWQWGTFFLDDNFYNCSFVWTELVFIDDSVMSAHAPGRRRWTRGKFRRRGGLCWQQSGGRSIAGFSRVPGRCQWCGRRGLCAKSNPTPLSDSLWCVCVTPVPLLALACYCRIPQRRRPRGQSQVLGACASQRSVE